MNFMSDEVTPQLNYSFHARCSSDPNAGQGSAYHSLVTALSAWSRFPGGVAWRPLTPLVQCGCHPQPVEPGFLFSLDSQFT